MFSAKSSASPSASNTERDARPYSNDDKFASEEEPDSALNRSPATGTGLAALTFACIASNEVLTGDANAAVSTSSPLLSPLSANLAVATPNNDSAALSGKSLIPGGPTLTLANNDFGFGIMSSFCGCSGILIFGAVSAMFLWRYITFSIEGISEAMGKFKLWRSDRNVRRNPPDDPNERHNWKT